LLSPTYGTMARSQLIVEMAFYAEWVFSSRVGIAVEFRSSMVADDDMQCALGTEVLAI
jgi:hypothetical protein